MAEDGTRSSLAASVAVLDAAEPTGRLIDTVAMPGAVWVEVAATCAPRRRFAAAAEACASWAAPVVGGTAAAETPDRIAVTAAGPSSQRSSGLLVFPVSEQASRRTFRPTGTFAARFAEDVAAAGSLAFVADGAAGLRIVAVEPGGSGTGGYRLCELSQFQPGGVVHAVSASGSRACIATGSSGVLVLDVSDPAAPRQLAAIPSPDARDLALEGDVLLVADATAGLRSFDLSVPERPAETARRSCRRSGCRWGRAGRSRSAPRGWRSSA
jgi:hypothetical protein